MRLLRWIIINTLFAIIAYFALYEEVAYAQNFLMFAIWFISIVTTITAFMDDIVAERREKGHPIPQWAEALYDMLFMSALATFGWFFYASLYAIHMVTQQYIYYGDDELDVSGETEESAESTN